MSVVIPESHVHLLQSDAVVHLVTLMSDGSPQATPIWIDYDGTHILVNSAKGRTKDRNMEARPQVAVSVLDPNNVYRYLSVRGRVIEITEEGAADHINQVLSVRYTGQEGQYGGPDEIRRIYKILPEHVVVHG